MTFDAKTLARMQDDASGPSQTKVMDGLQILNEFMTWSPDKTGIPCPINCSEKHRPWLKKLAALCDRVAALETSAIRDHVKPRASAAPSSPAAEAGAKPQSSATDPANSFCSAGKSQASDELQKNVYTPYYQQWQATARENSRLEAELEEARRISEKRKEMLLRIARERNAWQKWAEDAEARIATLEREKGELRETVAELTKRAEEAEREAANQFAFNEGYQEHIADLLDAAKPFVRVLKESTGNLKTQLLSFAHWHSLSKAYDYTIQCVGAESEAARNRMRDLQQRLAAAETRAQVAERRLEASADAAELAIQHYRCHYTVIDGDGDALPLVDKLTNGGSSEDGQQEMEMLVDAVCGAILHSTPDIKSSLVDARERLAAAEGVIPVAVKLLELISAYEKRCLRADEAPWTHTYAVTMENAMNVVCAAQAALAQSATPDAKGKEPDDAKGGE
jgi:hypothetical protein